MISNKNSQSTLADVPNKLNRNARRNKLTKVSIAQISANCNLNFYPLDVREPHAGWGSRMTQLLDLLGDLAAGRKFPDNPPSHLPPKKVALINRKITTPVKILTPPVKELTQNWRTT